MSAVTDVVDGAASAVARPFLPWIILAVVLAIIGAGGFGYYEGAHIQAVQDAAKYAAAQKKADDAWQVKLDEANSRGDQLAHDLEQEKANVKTVTVTVVKEVPKVTTVYKERPNAPAVAIPSAVITWGAVRLWNDALDPSVKHDVSKSAGVAAGAAAEADIVRAPVDIPDLLTNHAENSGQYAECRAALNKLIDWHEQNPTERAGVTKK